MPRRSLQRGQFQQLERDRRAPELARRPEYPERLPVDGQRHIVAMRADRGDAAGTVGGEAAGERLASTRPARPAPARPV